MCMYVYVYMCIILTLILLYNNTTTTTTTTENALYHIQNHSPNVCLKIARRLRDFLVAYNPQTMGQRKFAVIVGTGKCYCVCV